MSHDHHHGHGPDSANRTRLAVAFGITATILVAQAVGALLTGSLALLVDTAHMLTDAAGLAIALVAATLASRPPTARRTWGFRRAEVLAALAQSAVLLAVGVYVLVEGVQRLFEPPDVPARELVVFGVIGLVGNVVALAVLAGGRSSSMNLRAAFLEVVNDALGSVGVIVAAVVIETTGWQQADAVAGLLIGALILPRALKILREATSVLLETTPPGLDLDDVREHLLGVEHVVDVHDLHASLIATGLPVLSAHVVVDQGCFQTGHVPRILDTLQECVAHHFDVSVEHSTFQIEPAAHAAHESPSHP
ncbi:MAG: cation diffusion facilitator family transporter [Cellulomonas sp.]|uniref:cation diffusion facilitator family transporter n=1 Tax=unclassified Cellulomonas TaxID=2620175 RepID=UPI0006527CC4|nr:MULTISPECIES: cation diffusion facilitator family transporter [unclassified Cellulomonas]KMM44361.1 cation transporter [Cellulomonas sp. A375-1]MCR6648923.1 cation diffusion facilitator family transporter [Cellulomonas sp.]MCR6704907.1 cation diffusion facilitator family transporter [Cellulomonas sp.]